MTALKKIKHFTYMGIACIPLDNLVVVMIQLLSVMCPFELSQKLECGGTPCCLVIFASDNEQHIMFYLNPKKGMALMHLLLSYCGSSLKKLANQTHFYLI